jgi:pimeloyl-ACP methyl ester carboxylesterase
MTKHLGRVISGVVIVIVLASCDGTIIEIEERPLWSQVAGSGDQTIVFISGNGNDSSVWSDIEAQVRSLGVRTIIYDRAGVGQSALMTGPYQIDNEVEGLERMLEASGITGPVVFVAHSYGGLIAALAAEGNANIKGLIFVDAVLPDDLSDAVVASILAEYAPQFSALEEAAPELAKAIIPIVESYPATAKRIQSVVISPEIPFIDIVAERTWLSAPDDIAHIRNVHREFVAGSPTRSTILANRSGHNVMKDRPEIIIQAMARMLEQL